MNSAPQFGCDLGRYPNGWVCSSAGEHRLHTAGVTGSIPVTPTIQISPWCRSAAGGFAFLAPGRPVVGRQCSYGVSRSTSAVAPDTARITSEGVRRLNVSKAASAISGAIRLPGGGRCKTPLGRWRVGVCSVTGRHGTESSATRRSSVERRRVNRFGSPNRVVAPGYAVVLALPQKSGAACGRGPGYVDSSTIGSQPSDL